METRPLTEEEWKEQVEELRKKNPQTIESGGVALVFRGAHKPDGTMLSVEELKAVFPQLLKIIGKGEKVIL